MSTDSLTYGLASLVGFGFSNFLVAVISKKDNSLKIGLVIQVLGFLLSLYLIPFGPAINFKLQTFLLFSITGILIALGYIFLLRGYREGSISIVSSLMSTWALITSILSFLFGEETFSLRKIFGIAITVLGIVLISLKIKEILKEKKIRIIKGAKYAILSSVSWGVAFFLISFLGKEHNWLTTTIFSRFWTAITFLLFAAVSSIKTSKTFSNIPLCYLLTVLFDVFANTMFNMGFEKGETSIVSVLAGASPIVTVFLSAIITKEKLSKIQILGIMLCIFGIAALSL